MNKSDLKNGMTVKTRDNKTYMIFNGSMVNRDTSLSLYNLNDDLTYGTYPASDIIEVYSPMRTSFMRMLDIEDRYPIWSRNDTDKAENDIVSATLTIKKGKNEYQYNIDTNNPIVTMLTE